MSEILSVFEAVFSNLIDSISPKIDEIFSRFEKNVSAGNLSNDDLDRLLQKAIIDFCNGSTDYQTVLNTIKIFSTSNIDINDGNFVQKTNEKINSILLSLCSKFKMESNRTADKSFTIIHITSPIFRPTVFYHFQFLRSLTLIILTDIIYSIYSTTPVSQPISKIVQCAFHISIAPHRLSVIQNYLMNSWSKILYYVSTLSFSEISLAFEQYIDDSNSGLLLSLVSKVKAPNSFLESLLYTILQQKKRKSLSSSSLSSLAILLSHSEGSVDLMREFFKLAWSVKTNDSMKDGAIDLVTVLFNRLPEESKKVLSFYRDRVYKHIGSDNKTIRTARSFLRLIQGDISGVNNGCSTENIEFVGCYNQLFRSQVGSESFISVFMKTFFVKSNFSFCPDLFRDIIVHLAATETNHFVDSLLVQFIQLDVNDIRFQVLLDSIILINSGEFLRNSYFKVGEDQIKQINSFVRGMILKNLFILQKCEQLKKLSVYQTSEYRSIIDESDIIVGEFMTHHRFVHFDPCPDPPIPQYTFTHSPDVPLRILKCFTYCLYSEDFLSQELLELIVALSFSADSLISNCALSIIQTIVANQKTFYSLVLCCLSLIQVPDVSELQIGAVCILESILKNNSESLSSEVCEDIEAASLTVLAWDSPQARLSAMRCLKYISSKVHDRLYDAYCTNSDVICESAKLALLVMNVPQKPTLITPGPGTIAFERICCSRYNQLWFMFYVEIINTTIECDGYAILYKARKMIEQRVSLYLNETSLAIHHIQGNLLLYFDSFAQEELLTDEGVINQIDSSFDSEFSNILSKSSENIKRVVVSTIRSLHWKILPNALKFINQIPSSLYCEVSSTLAFIIQMPNNFTNILTLIFRPFLDFLSMLQSHFISLGINNTRQIKWDSEHLELLSKHETIAVNYCIIIAAVFNNIVGQIPEEEWPVSYRQILVMFLLHWSELPTTHLKVRTYSLNALIPIMKAGTIFTDGFQFELSMLDVMLECQMEGYDVLGSLLAYHFDILFDVFVKQVFVRSRREASIFFEAVLSSFESCSDADLLQSHVGSLLLLALFSGQDDPTLAKPILMTIAELYLDQTLQNDVLNAIENAENLDFVPIPFGFATEQLIEAGFEIMKSTEMVIAVKNIVYILAGWFTKIRVLPTNKYIVQGIPSKFRRFTVISFLEAMSSVSNILNEEQHDSFAQLWFELLRSADNSVVVLVCLFEFENVSIKKRIFSQLLEREPFLICKYLSRRCSFSYWYYLQTQRHQHMDSIFWVLPVLIRGFAEFVVPEQIVKLRYTVVVHLTLLFFESLNSSFSSLVSIFGPEFADSILLMTPGLEEGTPNMQYIAAKLAEGLHEIDIHAVEQWSDEAASWAVLCNDVKIATRSLMIFNSLRGTFHPSLVSLLCDAALYHMSHIIDEDYREVSKYVAECFELFYNNIDNPEIAPVAFNFAKEFLEFPEIGNSALKRAMPIFKYCADDPVLSSAAKKVLVSAFIPFASSLENDLGSQQLLKEIIKLINPPELLLVASVFLCKSRPFIEIDMTYDEIMKVPFDSQHATVALQMISNMTKTSSQPLLDSMLHVATELLKRFKDCIPIPVLLQFFNVSMAKISTLKSALNFILAASYIEPSLATQANSSTTETGKTLNSIKKKIYSMFPTISEPVPITNCKMIDQLRGIIDQINPPKIRPFSNQYEMFMGLKKAADNDKGGTKPTKRWSSSLSMKTGIMPNRSMLMLPAYQLSEDFQNTEFEPLPTPIVLLIDVDIPQAIDSRTSFLVSNSGFLSLKE